MKAKIIRTVHPAAFGSTTVHAAAGTETFMRRTFPEKIRQTGCMKMGTSALEREKNMYSACLRPIPAGGATKGASLRDSQFIN